MQLELEVGLKLKPEIHHETSLNVTERHYTSLSVTSYSLKNDKKKRNKNFSATIHSLLTNFSSNFTLANLRRRITSFSRFSLLSFHQLLALDQTLCSNTIQK